MTFESTLPHGEPDLMRASAYQRYLDELVRNAGGEASQTLMSSLSPSLLQDLMRFENDGRATELFEVVAAGMRHARNLVIHLQYDDRVLPLTMFPVERLGHCPIPIAELLSLRLSELQVLHVEPAVLRPLGDPETGLIGEQHLYHALAPLTWELAMRGSREALLPEISGMAAYRVVSDLPLGDLALSGSLLAAVRRLERETANLRVLSEWPGFNRARASRMLNALYLQAGLIISRTHPAATSDTWFSGV